MTPARSLAASVVALGFASALTAPQPALAAPAPCERPENFAAQSGATLLRIDKLEVRAAVAERPRTKSNRDAEKGPVQDAATRVLSSDSDPAIPDPEDSDTLSEGIGMIGTGALGYLGVLPKVAAAQTGDAAVVPSAKTGVAERGGALVNGLAERAASLGTRSTGTGAGTGTGTGTGTGSVGAAGGEPVGSGEQEADTRGRASFGSGQASGRAGRPAGGERPDADGGKPSRDDADDSPSGDDAGDNAGKNASDSADDSTGDDGSSDDQAGAAGSLLDRRSRGAGKDARTLTAAISEIGVGEARTAMIANARLASAAYARMLDGYPGDKGSATHAAMVKPLIQQAPPTNAKASQRSTPAGKAGPLRLGSGRMTTHAQWDTGMACGRVAGETGRADAALTGVNLLNSGRGPLVRVPGTMTSEGTTVIEHRDGEPRTVARSTVTADRIELAGGRVRLRVLRAPTLEAAMSATAGGKVSYRPAIVEISGDGIATKRLEAAGEHVDVSLAPSRHTAESTALRSLTDLGGLRKAEPLPMPSVPGLPPVAAPETESAPVPTAGIKLRVALGDVRHATKGHAVAARASAVKVSLTQSSASKGRGKDGYADKSGVSLSMALGVLEAAAVSPESRELTPAGAGGGLPVTGANVIRVIVAGGVLLLAGAAAVLFSRRRRRSLP